MESEGSERQFFFYLCQRESKDSNFEESIKRFKQRIRTLTFRKKSISMEERIEKLNRYLVGWLGYYQLAETHSIFQRLDSWIRRRLRMIRWKEWKKIKTKYKNLMKQGIKPGKAWEWANTRKAYWRIASSPILHKALGDKYWSSQGLKSLFSRYHSIFDQTERFQTTTIYIKMKKNTG